MCYAVNIVILEEWAKNYKETLTWQWATISGKYENTSSMCNNVQTKNIRFKIDSTSEQIQVYI